MIRAGEKLPDYVQDPQFPLLKSWIIRRTGLSYYSDKDLDFFLALERTFAVNSTLPSAKNLLDRLQIHPHDLDALVEQLTIGETFFFRHTEMFHALRNSVFPDLIRRHSASRCLRIWSAGCSIGAEPYSIAILLRELLGTQFKNWSIHILGTDINRKFLRIAEAGMYDPWTLRGVAPHILNRCFTQVGDRWQLTDRCRENVFFKVHNLAQDSFPDASRDLACYDLIICRNVMIYFDQPFIQKLAQKFYETLSPGGWLAVGHAEPHTGNFRMFRTLNIASAVLYQRPSIDEKVIAEPTIFEPRVELPAAWRPLLPVIESRPTVPTDGLMLSTPPTETVFKREGISETQALAQITAYADVGDLKKALQVCDQAMHEAPLCAGAYYYHGMILYQFGEWAAADRSLRRCLYLTRDLALAHYYLGLVQERLGRSGQRHFTNALELLVRETKDSLVPLGQGLTVREFRSLLTIPENLSTTYSMQS